MVAVAPRRAGRRDHQHRRRVGNADHVPDPPRVRRTTGDRQRLEHDRPGARRRSRAPSATGASCAGQRARAIRLGVRLAARRAASAPCCCSSLPVGGVLRDRPGPDRARAAAGRPPAADLGVGRRPARRRRAASSGRGGCGRRSSCTGVYGGYFGAAQGVILMGVLGIGIADDAAAPQRPQERAGRARQRRRRADLHPRRRRRLDRRRPDRGRLGRSGARSAPPSAAGSHPSSSRS